ncbi:MAG: hypothetical protein AB1650_01610 [Candidatus Omnitrophota bacterium]
MSDLFEKILEISSISSKGLIADGKWKMQFIGNTPDGWKKGDRITVAEGRKIGARAGDDRVSDTLVKVENLDKKSAAISMYLDGSVAAEKSFDASSESCVSLEKNIRLDVEATIKNVDGLVIEVKDAQGRLTRWQLDKLTARREIDWYEGDKVVISKGAFNRYRIMNMDQKDQQVGAVFMSDE